VLLTTPTYNAWLRPLIIGGAALAAVGLWLGSHFRNKILVAAAAGIAAVTLLAGPTAYALTTVNTPATGSIVAAGATVSGDGGGPGGQAGFGPSGMTRGPGADGQAQAGGTNDGLTDGGGPAGLGGPGGPGAASTADTGLISYLEANRGSAEYLVAAFGSHSSSPIIVATGEPVMTIGGFNGGDPAPTLAQFKQMVADGKVRFVLVGGGGMGGGPGGGGPGGGGTSQISSWVTQNGKAIDASTYGGSGTNGTLYDLSGVS
jgi:hypothetical protein